MDSISEERLKKVHPELAAKVLTMAALLAQEGILLRVVQGLRTWGEQALLYAKGRDWNGNVVDEAAVVTNAPPGHSWHEFGLAVDVCPIKFLNLKDWGVGRPEWTRVVEVGESLGLYSGSRFVHPKPDWPHFQFTGTLPISPNEDVRVAYKEGGVFKVWDAAGLSSTKTG